MLTLGPIYGIDRLYSVILFIRSSHYWLLTAIFRSLLNHGRHTLFAYGIIIISNENLGGKRVSSIYPKPEGMYYYRHRKDILCHATG
jgi:hypothetical protein